VLASSCSMYGAGGGAGALDEAAPLAPLTEYAVSKVRSESAPLELASETVRILSDGTPWRPLVHIRDIAAATVCLLEAPRELVHGETFNIGPPDENYQVSAVAELVRLAVHGGEGEFGGNDDPDLRTYRVGLRKVRTDVPRQLVVINRRTRRRPARVRVQAARA
jgi:nucleoside-diphosphate-sugar epimerase